MSVVTSTSAPGVNLSAAQSSPMPRFARSCAAVRSRIQAIRPNSPEGGRLGIEEFMGDLKWQRANGRGHIAEDKWVRPRRFRERPGFDLSPLRTLHSPLITHC